MAVNKVLDKNHNVIIDLSNDTVDGEHLAVGYTAHNSFGKVISGSAVVDEKDHSHEGVVFLDLFGDVIYEYTKAEALELSELPAVPDLDIERIKKHLESTTSSDGRSRILGFKKILEEITVVPDVWSMTLTELKSSLSSADYIQVLPLYKQQNENVLYWWITQSSMNYSNWVSSSTYRKIDLTFLQTVPNSVIVDWGDGTTSISDDKFSVDGSDYSKITVLTHTYSESDYVYYYSKGILIKLIINDGQIFIGEDGNRSIPSKSDRVRTPIYSYYNTNMWVNSYQTILPSKRVHFRLANWKNTNGDGFYLNNLCYIGQQNLVIDRPNTTYGYYTYLYFYNYLPDLNAFIPKNLIQYCSSTYLYYYGYFSISYLSNYNVNPVLPVIDYLSDFNENTKILSFGITSSIQIKQPFVIPKNIVSNAYSRLLNSFNTDMFSNFNQTHGLIFPDNYDFTKEANNYLFYGKDLPEFKVLSYLTSPNFRAGTYCFGNNLNLFELNIPWLAYQTPSYLFYSCSKLKKVTFDNDFEYISDYMFQSCSQLEYVHIPSSCYYIGSGAFNGCASNTTFVIEKHKEGIDRTIQDFLNDETSSDTYYYGRHIYYRVTKDEFKNYFLSELLEKKKIIYPLNLWNRTYILDTNGTYSYNNEKYSLLESFRDEILNIEDIEVSPDERGELNEPYLYLLNYKTITIPNTVTYIYNTSYCKECEKVYFDGTFNEFINIKFTRYGNTDYNNYWTGTYNPTYYGAELYVLDENGEYEHNGKNYSKAPTTIVAPTSIVDGLVKVPQHAVYGYGAYFTKIKVPNGVTQLDEYACSQNAVDEIELPEGITYIKRYALYYNIYVKELTIPSTIIRMDYYACAYMLSLLRLNFLPTTMPEFRDSNNNKENYSGTSVNSPSYAFYRNVNVREFICKPVVDFQSNNYYGCLGYFRDYIINETDPSKIKTDINGHIYYENGSTFEYLGYEGNDTTWTIPDYITDFGGGRYNYHYYKILGKNTKLKKIILPDSHPNITTLNKQIDGFNPFSYFVTRTIKLANQFEELYVGKLYKYDSSLSLKTYYPKLKILTWNAINMTNTYSPYWEYTSSGGSTIIYKYYHHPTEQWLDKVILGKDMTSLDFLFNTGRYNSNYYAFIPAKEICLQSSETTLSYGNALFENSYPHCFGFKYNLINRPITFNSSYGIIYPSETYYNLFALNIKEINVNVQNTSLSWIANYNSQYYYINPNGKNKVKLTLNSTKLTSLPGSTVFRYGSFKEVVFPQSLTSIYGNWFYDSYYCIGLGDNTIFTFTTTTPPTCSSRLAGDSSFNYLDWNTITIRVPQGSKTAYSTATNWPSPDLVKYVEYDPETGEDIVEGE